MKRIFLRTGLFALVAVQLLSSCKKDNSTTPSSASSKLLFNIKSDNAVSTFNGYSTTNGVSTNATGNATLIWTSGTANISSFKLEAKKSGAAIEITSKGMANVDLFSLSAVTANTTITAGTYTGIELTATLVKSATAPSLVLNGNFRASTGALTPVELDFSDDAFIQAEVSNMTVDGTADVTATVNLQLNRLITSIPAADFANATVDENGAILISSTSNTNIYRIIKSNISNNSGTADFSTKKKTE